MSGSTAFAIPWLGLVYFLETVDRMRVSHVGRRVFLLPDVVPHNGHHDNGFYEKNRWVGWLKLLVLDDGAERIDSANNNWRLVSYGDPCLVYLPYHTCIKSTIREIERKYTSPISPILWFISVPPPADPTEFFQPVIHGYIPIDAFQVSDVLFRILVSRKKLIFHFLKDALRISPWISKHVLWLEIHPRTLRNTNRVKPSPSVTPPLLEGPTDDL